MSFTNKTPNYNLPQWLGTDKPAWLTDVNGAFSSIDTAIKNAYDSGSGADATANAALETARAAQETANGAVEQADNANTKADAANVTAANAQTATGGAVSTANEALANSKIALGYGNWKIRNVKASDVQVIEEITKSSAAPYRRFVYLYNENLKIMQISGSLELTSIGTLTKHVDIKLADGTSFTAFPVYKLPFTCTGSIMINSTALFGGETTINGSKLVYQRDCIAAITSYNGSAWMCYVTGPGGSTAIFPGEPLTKMESNCLWLQVSALGTIVLDGWEPVK